MSRKYKFHDQDRMFFVTYGIVGWIDVFTRTEYCTIVLDSLKYCCTHKGLEIYAWCIMTNHVHLIIGTQDKPMEDVLRDHKRHTSEELVSAIQRNPSESRKDWMLALFREYASNNSNNTNHQVWQQHNKPIELYTPEIIFKYLDYLHNNPVKSGLVSEPEHWQYSSALDYSGKNGLLDCLIPINKGIWGD